MDFRVEDRYRLGDKAFSTVPDEEVIFIRAYTRCFLFLFTMSQYLTIFLYFQAAPEPITQQELDSIDIEIGLGNVPMCVIEDV